MKIIFYSALFGNYDVAPKVNKNIPKKYKFILFTDQKNILARGYDVIQIKRPDKSAIISNRIIKFKPYEYCDDYQLAVYHDSNIEIKLNFIKYIEKNLNSFGVINIFRHPKQNNIYAELSTLFNLGKINFKMQEMAKKYIESNIKDDSFFPCSENNIFITKPTNIKNKHFFDELIYTLKTVISRDQIVLSVLLSKYKINYKLYDSLYVDLNKKFFNHKIHKEGLSVKLLNQYKSFANIFMYLYKNSYKI